MALSEAASDEVAAVVAACVEWRVRSRGPGPGPSTAFVAQPSYQVRPSAAHASPGGVLEVPISRTSYMPPGGNSVAARAFQDRPGDIVQRGHCE
eukprot:6532292-Alexandrium_andersonii.AAC.1